MSNAARAVRTRLLSTMAGSIAFLATFGQAAQAQSTVEQLKPLKATNQAARHAPDAEFRYANTFTLLGIPQASEQHGAEQGEKTQTGPDLKVIFEEGRPLAGDGTLPVGAANIVLVPLSSLPPDMRFSALPNGRTGESFFGAALTEKGLPFPLPGAGHPGPDLISKAKFCPCDDQPMLGPSDRPAWFDGTGGSDQDDLIAFHFGAPDLRRLALVRGGELFETVVFGRWHEGGPAGGQGSDQPFERVFPTTGSPEVIAGVGRVLGRASSREPRLAAFTEGRPNSLAARTVLPRGASGDDALRRRIEQLTAKREAQDPAIRDVASLERALPDGNGGRDDDVQSLTELPFDDLGGESFIVLIDDDDFVREDEKPVVLENGWIIARGLKVPVGRLSFADAGDDSKEGQISLVPFIDTGSGQYVEVTNPYQGGGNPFGIGAGIGWQITDQTKFRLGVDIPVIENDAAGEGQGLVGVQFRLATSLGNFSD